MSDQPLNDDSDNSLTASGSSVGTHEDLASWKKMQEIPADSELASVRHTLPISVVRPSSSPSGATGSLRPSSAGILHDNMSELSLGQASTVGCGGGKPFRPLPPRGDKVVPPAPPDMEDLEWYHFNISRHVAESILISTGEDGSYLLRDSATNLGEFTLSVRAKNSVKHFPVKWDGKEFTFGFGHFSSVHELSEHFASRPVIGGDSGVLTLLKFPYPRCVDEPETYDQIRVHAEWGAQFKSNKDQDAGAPTFAIASKEGYLTKLGYHRKTWRTRWFVLFKNELSYYKTRDEKAALRTINITDVMDVLADDSQGKQNCFRIITPYRTFFLFAGTAQEAEEWISILRWKLDHPKGTETAQRHNRV